MCSVGNKTVSCLFPLAVFVVKTLSILTCTFLYVLIFFPAGKTRKWKEQNKRSHMQGWLYISLQKTENKNLSQSGVLVYPDFIWKVNLFLLYVKRSLLRVNKIEQIWTSRSFYQHTVLFFLTSVLQSSHKRHIQLCTLPMN